MNFDCEKHTVEETVMAVCWQTHVERYIALCVIAVHMYIFRLKLKMGGREADNVHTINFALQRFLQSTLQQATYKNSHKKKKGENSIIRWREWHFQSSVTIYHYIISMLGKIWKWGVGVENVVVFVVCFVCICLIDDWVTQLG